MKIQQPVREFTGMFPPVNSSIVIVLSYEADGALPDAKQYAEFIEKVGGFDPWNAKLTPMKWDSNQLIEHYLDSMTGAFERGFLSQSEWPSQLFTSWQARNNFLDALEAHLDRFCDRHHRMLDALCAGYAEVIVTGDQAAEGLRDAIQALKN